MIWGNYYDFIGFSYDPFEHSVLKSFCLTGQMQKWSPERVSDFSLSTQQVRTQAGLKCQSSELAFGFKL